MTADEPAYVLFNNKTWRTITEGDSISEAKRHVLAITDQLGEQPNLSLMLRTPKGPKTLTGDELLNWARADASTEGEGG